VASKDHGDSERETVAALASKPIRGFPDLPRQAAAEKQLLRVSLRDLTSNLCLTKVTFSPRFVRAVFPLDLEAPGDLRQSVASGDFMDKPAPLVCIVGAGPAGLALAHLLRRANITFVVLERQNPGAHRAVTKAGMIEPRTVELLRSHGLADTVLKRGARNGLCEFRADGKAFVLDYGRLTNGPGHYVYPQHELVDDWTEELRAAGGEIHFGIRVTAIEQDAHGAVVAAIVEATGQQATFRSEIVAVCSGAGIGPMIGSATIATVEFSYPVRWIAVIASVSPTRRHHTIYGLHRHGFAGQMRRSATMTRYYLEVPRADALDDWPDDRVWAELQERLKVAGQPPLVEGRLIERDILDLRVFVREPMQDGRVFLVGDAAHLVTPAGGKGMNMAVQDAVELAAGLRDQYAGPCTGERLARYSATRLPAVWQYEEFSNLMLSLLHSGRALAEPTSTLRIDPEPGLAFANRLRCARLERVLNDPLFSRWFAHAYAGVDQ
jgi:p-hydroxybenzoate 3-monooxygenase